MHADSRVSPVLPDVTHPAAAIMAADLRRIFGGRLHSLVAYAPSDARDGELHTLALVDRVAFSDLAACLPLMAAWQRAGAAVPLILGRDEFLRTLDVFPLEYGEIIAHHAIIAGDDPFAGYRVAETDVRRACELQAKSHLIHLREGFLESRGDPASVARLMAASAPAFRTLLANINRLDSRADDRAVVPEALVEEVAQAAHATIADPTALFSRYIAAVERLWQVVDGWKR